MISVRQCLRQDRLKQPTHARETLHTWIRSYTELGLHVNPFTSEQQSVSHYIYYKVKSPLDLLAKAGCGHGKVLKCIEGKVMGDGILGLRACVRAPEKGGNIY
jgi:hypothetical protein